MPDDEPLVAAGRSQSAPSSHELESDLRRGQPQGGSPSFTALGPIAASGCSGNKIAARGGKRVPPIAHGLPWPSAALVLHHVRGDREIPHVARGHPGDLPALGHALVASGKDQADTLKRWAETLGMKDAVKLLDATLKEEAQTDAA